MKPSKETEKRLREHCGADDQAIEKLEIYARMVAEWQAAINLVAPSTLPQIWERHILDSAQIYPLFGADKKLVDLGSGGGMPAIILAILGAQELTLIESDQRKCIFLREVSRETGLSGITVINKRLEQVDGIKAPVITARALAPLLQLVGWARPFIEPQGRMIFLKGQDFQNEINELTQDSEGGFLENIELIQSITDEKARIVVLHNS